MCGGVVEVGPLGHSACPQTRRAATFPCPVHQATYVRHDELHSRFFLLHLPVVREDKDRAHRVQPVTQNGYATRAPFPTLNTLASPCGGGGEGGFGGWSGAGWKGEECVNPKP